MTYEDEGLAPELRAALADELIALAARHFRMPFDPVARPDIYDQCRAHLVGAARTWDSARATFKTHAFNALRHALLLRGERVRIGRASYERAWQAARNDAMGGADQSAPEAERRVREGLAALDDRSREYVTAWLEHGQNYAATARALKMSKSKCRGRVLEGMARLKCVLDGTPQRRFIAHARGT